MSPNRKGSMKYGNFYFINGTAYAGKSTVVRALAKKYDGIACEENYHNSMLSGLDKAEFPNLTYIRDIADWGDFVRRTPQEYLAWIEGCNRECTVLELKILEGLTNQPKRVFVDTNISIEALTEISDRDHVLFMLSDPEISVNRFFDRPDREKQFIYQLLMKEEDPAAALENYRACLSLINSRENYNRFLNSGFNVLLRDEQRPPEETLALVERAFHLS